MFDDRDQSYWPVGLVARNHTAKCVRTKCTKCTKMHKQQVFFVGTHWKCIGDIMAVNLKLNVKKYVGNTEIILLLMYQSY